MLWAGQLYSGMRHTARILTQSRHPWGTLTNDRGLSAHGQEPAAASWALLPDECDSSRPVTIPGQGVNVSSGIQNNNEVCVIFIKTISLSIIVAVIQLLWIFKDASAYFENTGGRVVIGATEREGTSGSDRFKLKPQYYLLLAV